MDQISPLAGILKKFIDGRGRSLQTIVEFTCDLEGTPRISIGTLKHWLQGRKPGPSRWPDMVWLAAYGLELGEAETNELLNAAGFQSLTVLRRKANDEIGVAIDEILGRPKETHIERLIALENAIKYSFLDNNGQMSNEVAQEIAKAMHAFLGDAIRTGRAVGSISFDGKEYTLKIIDFHTQQKT
jgi:hypothetical protein